MQKQETVYLRGPRTLLYDFLWFASLCRVLMKSGNKNEKMRIWKYVGLQSATILGASTFCFVLFVTRSLTALSLVLCVLVPLFFIYRALLDITRRIRPLNSGPLTAAVVLKVLESRGLRTFRVKSAGLIFDCHIYLQLRAHPIVPGDHVVLGRHPNDRHIAAIIDATPQVIFAENRRSECAEFIERERPFKDRKL